MGWSERGGVHTFFILHGANRGLRRGKRGGEDTLERVYRGGYPKGEGEA